MRNKILLFALIVLFAACKKSNDFTVSGTIVEAEGEMLYFEKNGLLADTLLDSVKLNDKGKFRFKVRNAVYPDLYRLRLNKQNILLGADSAENIQINALAGQLLDAQISGSLASVQIQELRKSLRNLRSKFDMMSTEQGETEVEQFNSALETHKNDVKALVLNNPLSIASYYALFQQIDGNFVFTPYSKEDRPYFQSVATAFTGEYPEYERTKNIYNIVISALHDARQSQAELDWLDLAVADSRGYIEIELKDKNGYPKKLSDLEGQPVLLDFTSYALESSIEHTFALREAYDKHSAAGLKIFQVSLDQNFDFWASQSSAMPWTCVIDPNGNAARVYNIQQIPTLFLISKDGNIAGRYSDVQSAIDNLSRIL